MKIYAVLSGTNAAPDPTYRTIAWATYSEDGLRKWINSVWGTPLDASLPAIATAIARGGWLLFEHVAPDAEAGR